MSPRENQVALRKRLSRRENQCRVAKTMSRRENPCRLAKTGMLSEKSQFRCFVLGYQPMTMFDSIALRACSKSLPVSIRYRRMALTLSPAERLRQ